MEKKFLGLWPNMMGLEGDCQAEFALYKGEGSWGRCKKSKMKSDKECVEESFGLDPAKFTSYVIA